MQTYYRDFVTSRFGRTPKKTAVLQVRIGDSNWRECDVHCIDGRYVERERNGVRQVQLCNIAGREHIEFKWVDESELRWFNPVTLETAWRGFFAEGE